ncbi:DUF6221 family protein [Geodermatophilus sp. SYSU D00703]
MSDLATFLLARIAEDEAVAVQLADLWAKAYYAAGPDALAPGVREGVDAVFAAAHAGPARIRTEIHIKRRLVELCTSRLQGAPSSDADGEHPHGPEDLQVLRLLALPYVGHPDYRTAWLP